MEKETRTTTAVNGMRARRFGGAINYARTPKPAVAVQPAGMKVDEIAPVTQHYEANPVQAPAVNIGTMKPAVPNVQPKAPVTTNLQSVLQQDAAAPMQTRQPNHLQQTSHPSKIKVWPQVTHAKPHLNPHPRPRHNPNRTLKAIKNAHPIYKRTRSPPKSSRIRDDNVLRPRNLPIFCPQSTFSTQAISSHLRREMRLHAKYLTTDFSGTSGYL